MGGLGERRAEALALGIPYFDREGWNPNSRIFLRSKICSSIRAEWSGSFLPWQMPCGYKSSVSPPAQTARSRRFAGADPTSLLLARLFDLQPVTFLRQIPGRETFAWDARSFFPEVPGDSPAVVKRTRGPAGREGLADLLRGRKPRSAGKREYDNLAELRADGLPVPRPLAFSEDAASRSILRGLFALFRPPQARPGSSLVVMDRIENGRSLRDVVGDCAGSEERRALSRELFAVVRRLHGRGWYHRDLYLQHFLRDAEGALHLIDVGRARRERAPRKRWYKKDLAALAASCPPNVTTAEKLRFALAWLDAMKLSDPKKRRAWIAGVASKARRIASRRPRYVDAASDPQRAS